MRRSLSSDRAFVGLLLVGLGIIAWVAFQHGGRAWAAVLAVLCPYSLNGVLVGTFDAWSLAGIYVAYLAAARRAPWLFGLGLLLATTKPQHILVTGPVLLLGVRGWPRPLLLKAAVIPALTLVLSFAVFGPDWPVRWWENYRAQPPGGYIGSAGTYLVTSTYAATNLAGIPLLPVAVGALLLAGFVLWQAWHEGLTHGTLALAVTANAIVSPHMLSQEYVGLLAIPWVGLAVRRPWLAALPYAISLPVLFRAQGLWDRLGLLDVTFPLVLMALLLLDRHRSVAVRPSRTRSQEMAATAS